jgi:microsomal epoxide hydrolase
MIKRTLISLSAACLLTLVFAAPEARAATTVSLNDGWLTTSDGVRLHYLVGGSGSTVVFIPGWTMPGDIWEAQLGYFGRTHRVVALDPRSQGRSDSAAEGNFVDRRAQDIHELVSHLGTGQAVLIGWSLAVAELLQLVERFGTAQVSGLVLVDGAIWVTPNSEYSSFIDATLVSLLRDRKEMTARFVREMYRSPQPPEYLERITRSALATPTSAAYTLLSDAYASGRRDWRTALDRVDCPLLYVAAPHFKGVVDTVRARVPQSQIEVFENAGHALFVDEAEHFNRVLEVFLQALSETATEQTR